MSLCVVLRNLLPHMNQRVYDAGAQTRKGPLPEPGKGILTCGFIGGAEGTRTPDPLVANEVRYQLRHSPVVRTKR